MIYAIIAQTQVLENYGTEDTPYWKPKGGRGIWIANIEADHILEAKILSPRLHEVAKVETRNSTMMIEFVTDFEAIQIEEAVMRSKIDTSTHNIDPEDYFSAIDALEMIHTYKAGDPS